MRRYFLLPVLFAAFCGAGGAAELRAAPPTTAPAEAAVTIYRCTDARGRLTLRDSPCEPGERQQTRSMLRPKDAPARPASSASAPPPPAPQIQPPPQVIVIAAPRPMYECVTPDNARYLSDTPEGNPRFVPLWTLGYPVWASAPPVREPGQLDVRVDDGRVQGSFHNGGGSVPQPLGTVGYGTAGGWVRDVCYALPPAEVCARVRDRRDAVRRRFANAQPTERAALAREERGIDARLAQDCR